MLWLPLITNVLDSGTSAVMTHKASLSGRAPLRVKKKMTPQTEMPSYLSTKLIF